MPTRDRYGEPLEESTEPRPEALDAAYMRLTTEQRAKIDGEVRRRMAAQPYQPTPGSRAEHTARRGFLRQVLAERLEDTAS